MSYSEDYEREREKVREEEKKKAFMEKALMVFTEAQALWIYENLSLKDHKHSQWHA